MKHISDNELIFRIHKEVLQLHHKKNNPVKTGKRFEPALHQEDRQMDSKHMKNQNLGVRYAVATVIPLFT